MNRFFLIISSFVLAFLFSCGKQKVKIEYINSALIKEALNIKDGSYFIYRDSISGIIDSFWVAGYSETIYGNDYYYKVESIGYYMYHKDSLKRFAIGGSGKSYGGLEFIGCSFRLDSLNFWGVKALSDPQRSYEKIDVLYVETLNDYTLNNNTFREVYVYTNGDSINFTQSYYSPADGLVKLNIKNSNVHIVYELLNSKIKK